MHLDCYARCAAPPRTGTLVDGQIGRRPWTIGIAIAAVVLHVALALGVTVDALELSRHSLSQLRLWTALTGPLLHVSRAHLLYDVLGLLVVGWVFEPLLGRSFPLLIVVISAAVSCAFFVFYPDLQAYRGLSALDQGLFAAGLCALWREGRSRLAAGLLVLLTVKWIVEVASGASSPGLILQDPRSFGVAVPWTHVAGGIAGIVGAHMLRAAAAKRLSN